MIRDSPITSHGAQGLQRFTRVLCLVSCVLCLTHCAQMGEPNGGLKDSAAPELISEKTFPKNQSVNFNDEKIVISFNEYIQLKSQSIVITPAFSKKPTIKSTGKKVEIIFNEKPQANTTYTINLSGAVSDITENNTVQNLNYVFSTGSYLDSMSISGKVVNAFSQAGIGSSTVILHDATIDSAIVKQKPSYYLKTEKDGTFKFSNLKAGSYNLYSLNDKNADLLFNGYPEEISFLDSSIHINAPVNQLKLLQFKATSKQLYQTSTSSISKWTQVYKYNKILSNITIEPLNGNFKSSISAHTNFSKDSVFYLTLNDTLIKDTIRMKLISENSVIDTIQFISHLSKKMSSKPTFKIIAPLDFYVTDSIFIATNMQSTFKKELISVYDTLHKKEIPFTVTTNFHGVKIIPDKQTEKIPMRVVCLPGAITATVNKTSNDTLKSVSIYLPIEKMGSISLALKEMTQEKFSNPVCVLLMDGKYLRKQTIDIKSPLIHFDLLKPANYSFYVFNDNDANGIWSPGDIESKLQPEKISWYTQSVKVKANWTQDLTWIF